MTNKEKFLEALNASGGLHSIQVGSRLFIFDSGSRKKVEKQATTYAIRSGEMIYRADGSRVFYKWSPVERAGYSGSERYDWHEDENRVRQALMKVTIVQGCEPMCVVLKHEFRNLEVE